MKKRKSEKQRGEEEEEGGAGNLSGNCQPDREAPRVFFSSSSLSRRRAINEDKFHTKTFRMSIPVPHTRAVSERKT